MNGFIFGAVVVGEPAGRWWQVAAEAALGRLRPRRRHALPADRAATLPPWHIFWRRTGTRLVPKIAPEALPALR